MSYSSVVLSDSPYAYYRLQESSGTTAVDSSGNGRNATYVGTVVFGQTGPFSGDVAVSLDGKTGGISTPVNPAGWATYSIEAWIYGTGISGNPFGTQTYSIPVIAASDRTDQDNTGFEAWFNENGSPRFDVSQASGGSTNVHEGSALSSGQWYHIVFVNGSSNDEIIYVNGAAVASGGAAGALGGTYDITIGYQPNTNYSQSNSFLKGYMAECAIYNTALTSTQVSNHYAAATASASSTVNVSVKGGSSTNGSASGTETMSISVSGGSTSGGTSSDLTSSVLNGNVEGGSSSGGQSTGTEGILTTGSSVGGSSSSGRASTTAQQDMSPAGGSSSGGDATEDSTQYLDASGGSTTGGSTVANVGETTSGTISGGSQSGGSSTGGGVTNRVQAQIQLQSSLDNQIVLNSSLDNQIYLQSGVMPMAALNQNFNLLQYSSDQITFTHAGDLTGCTLEWVMELNRGSTTPTIKKTTSNGITITSTSPTQSTYVVTITNDDMAPVSPREYYHQVTLVDVLGESNPIAEGTVTVEAASNT